jgi:hypothetical protein
VSVKTSSQIAPAFDLDDVIAGALQKSLLDFRKRLYRPG